MDSLRDAFDAIEGRRKTLDVYTGEDAVASDLETQFSTRNVRVTRHPMPSGDDPGFVVVRDVDGEFRGAFSIDQLQALLSPEIHPPWTLGGSDVNYEDLFDFLDNTLFTSYDRRQMLAAAREIEERAWRANAGTLRVGFQNSAAFGAQVSVYDRFASERDVTVRIFVDDEWVGDVDNAIDVVSDAGDEIGQFWFVIFDGGESDLNACGLLAEEREPDRYYGFWTYDPGRISDLVSYLESTYGNP